MSDEWSQPDAPPPPMFAGKKERDLVKQVNDELIERVIGQTIAYYAIDMKTSNFHSLYGEAIEKTFLPPIRVYALVEKAETDRTYSSEKETSFFTITSITRFQIYPSQDISSVKKGTSLR